MPSWPAAPRRMSLNAGTWVIDAAASRVSFRAASFFGLLPVQGSAPVLSGTATVGPTETSAVAIIDLAAVDTGMATRDKHLRGTDFFDVAHYPVATFTSSGLTERAGQWTLEGFLTVRDTTGPVVVTGMIEPQPDGSVLLHASASVDRTTVGFTRLRGMIPATVRVTVLARLTRTDTPQESS